MGVALSGGCHAVSSWKAYFVEFYGRAAGFWLFDFYDLSRNQFLSYSQFHYVKLKLKSRAFCWLIVWFCIGNGSFTILNLVGFSFCLTHPVLLPFLDMFDNTLIVFYQVEPLKNGVSPILPSCLLRDSQKFLIPVRDFWNNLILTFIHFYLLG